MMITDEEQRLRQVSCMKVDGGGGGAAAKSAVASSRHWSASTESRIVRVSRVFGGKDRHSKVRTVKGLRDRRVRLSVPTAIQLYDLQDRLGLSQPSKVVDWLLDAAQGEIDKLPPLQFPPHELELDLAAAHHGHLPPSSMAPPFASERAAAAASMHMQLDGDRDHCNSGGMKGFMSLNNSLGMFNGGAGAGMPSLAHGSYYGAAAADSWGNAGDVHGGASHHQVVGHSHSSAFPSLLSLATGSQLVFYSPEGGFAMKEAGGAGGEFPVDSFDDDHSQGQLSLSSARSFLHSGSQG